MGVKYYERELHKALVNGFQEVFWLSRQVISCLTLYKHNFCSVITIKQSIIKYECQLKLVCKSELHWPCRFWRRVISIEAILHSRSTIIV